MFEESGAAIFRGEKGLENKGFVLSREECSVLRHCFLGHTSLFGLLPRLQTSLLLPQAFSILLMILSFPTLDLPGLLLLKERPESLRTNCVLS